MPAVDRGTAGELERRSARQPLSTHPSDWTDQEFREAFESLQIPSEMFHHREHIHLAWMYSCNFPQEQALARMVQGIQAFAKHHGAAAKYHQTITAAWMRLVWHAVRQSSLAPDFHTFACAHPYLFHPRLLEDYYSAAQLQSDAARHAWIEPDLRSLP